MRAMFGLVLLVGVALAGGAVYLAQGYLGASQAQLEAERARMAKLVEATEVFILARSMRYGEELTVDDIRVTKWPAQALPEGIFTDFDALFPEGPEVPRTVTRAMERGEPIMEVKVTGPGQEAGITSRLDEGMRAFAIDVDVSSGVSGFLRPGDRVDIFWTGEAVAANVRQREIGDITKLIETNVELIAIDQSADEDRDEASIARTVTVQASPQQVAALAQAQSAGRLSLALVGASDNTVATAVQVDQRTLLGVEEEQIVEAQEERVCTIRTRRGAEVVEIPIPCTN